MSDGQRVAKKHRKQITKDDFQIPNATADNCSNTDRVRQGFVVNIPP